MYIWIIHYLPASCKGCEPLSETDTPRILGRSKEQVFHSYRYFRNKIQVLVSKIDSSVNVSGQKVIFYLRFHLLREWTEHGSA